MVTKLFLEAPLVVKKIIGSSIVALPFDTQVSLMLQWASSHQSKFVCLANVHMLIEAYWVPRFASVLENADLVAPDGMPLVWILRLMGARGQDRVAGMDVFLALCRSSQQHNVSIFCLGSQKMILDRMRAKLECEFPDLRIAGMEPLPFRPSTEAENNAVIHKIHESGAGIVFVSLGCPKQEYWMAHHQGKVQAVMIGMGAVFPVYAGIFKRAPRLLRNLGLEWAYRLAQEPSRLWSRYLKTNTIFTYLVLRQLLASRLNREAQSD